jgi:DNA-binding Xre family transcriptional regulator
MAVANAGLRGFAVADTSVEDGGRTLRVTFVDGRTVSIVVAELPFASEVATRVRASLDGSFVTLDGAEGPFDVTAHELAAIAAGRSLTRPDLAKRVGENLRAVRTAKAISLRELSRQSGIAAPNISNFENGHTSPRLETLGRLAEVLGVTVASLVSLNGEASARVSDYTESGESGRRELTH